MSNTYFFIHLTKKVCVVAKGVSLVSLLRVPLQRCFRRINKITHIHNWTKCEREETHNSTVKKKKKIILAVTFLDNARTSNCFNTIRSVFVTPAGKCNMLNIRPAQWCFLT